LVPIVEAATRRREPARGQVASAWPAAACVVLPLLASGCLPQEDLSEYSRAWLNEPAPAVPTPADAGSSAPDASLSGGGSSGGGSTGGSETPPPLLDAGADAGPSDAGAGPDAALADAAAAPALDAGDTISIGDAAAAASESCTSLGGELQLGTRDCFVAVATPVDWQGAVAGCQALGMTLVAVTSLERDAFIASLSSGPIWIGGRDASFFMFPGFANPAGNVFTWLDGSAVANLNWAPGEPDGAANEFCIEKSNGAGEPWFERACSELKPYVCEITL
jgi:lectin-like protein